ncbi:MAG: choice-of-anchor X domain-containing protein [Acidobacteriota bacterium]
MKSKREDHGRQRIMIPSMFFVLVATMTACGSDDDPTAPTKVGAPSSVAISIDGVNVTDTTITRGPGDSTRYVAHVPAGTSLATWVRYQTPMMMMGEWREQMMFDDGTHGDMMAGDGEYCYEDHGEMAGMHGMGAAMGHYGFEFYCTDEAGNHGDHVPAWVNVQ